VITLGSTRRLVAPALVAAALLAACTSTSDVAVKDPADAPTADSSAAPASTAAPQEVDGSTPIAAPDATGLPSLSDPDPAIVIGQLDNGLRYFIRDNDNPGGRVEMRLAIDAGSALEDDTQIGGAHFLEHMLFNGTEEFPENELIDVLRSFGAGFGADINAYTSYDETVYQLTMPTEDAAVVDTGLDVLQQWLSAATIDQAQVEAERGIVLDEWRGSESSANGRIFDALESLFLAGSPYEGKDPIGTDAAIEATNAEPLRGFYDDWYRPDNAAVVVVGDIDTGDIEAGITERFGPVVARGASPTRPDLSVEPESDAQVMILTDPDVAEGFAQVTLPLAVTEAESVEADYQNSLLDSMAFDIIATRLGNDALRGDVPFDDARVDSSGFVRSLDAPEIIVSADGDALEASTQAVFDEYERVRRFGFSEAEVERVVDSYRTAAQSGFDGRESRQDADFADEYVRHALTDEPIPTAEAQYDFTQAVLDRASPETIAYRFVQRLAVAGPHVLVVVPESEAADVADVETFTAQATSMRDRELSPRPDDAGIDGDLMSAPDPIDEIAGARLSDNGMRDFVDPIVLEFDNGVRVSLNTSTIVEGQVAFEARSPGGLAVLDDADVPAADAAGVVVSQSGLATYGPVELADFLSDRDVYLQGSIDAFTEGLYGSAATSDLETLFQLIHLSMTQPRVDPVALEQYLDDELAIASDPSIDAGYAEFVTLLEARYDDPRFLLPTVDSLNSVTADDIERVVRDRFGDASDFAFAFSGDFNVAEVTELSRRYLATLPSTGRVESVDYVEPAPPAGVVAERTNAGEGEQASVAFLFTAPATPERESDVLAAIMQEVVTARLTDVVREELGDSYSPYSFVQVTDGGQPNAETYISNTTGPELLDEVVAAVLEQLDDLRTNGPTEAEFAAASENIRQQFDLFSNEQVNDEVLAVLTDPVGNASFDEFLDQPGLVGQISADDLRDAMERWLPADQYIEVRVLPR
jgi:zinc protease